LNQIYQPPLILIITPFSKLVKFIVNFIPNIFIAPKFFAARILLYNREKLFDEVQ